MMAAPAFAAAMPSATISSTEIGIVGWRSRVQAPLIAASIQTLGMAWRTTEEMSVLAERRALVDDA